MQIKPIKSETEYNNILKKIEKLMDAKPNTREGERLDTLATLAVAWEEKHHPVEPK